MPSVQIHFPANLDLTAIFKHLTKDYFTKDYHTGPEKYQRGNCHFIVRKENKTKKEVKPRELVSGFSVSSLRLSLLKAVKWGGELFLKGFLIQCNPMVMLPCSSLPFTPQGCGIGNQAAFCLTSP